VVFNPGGHKKWFLTPPPMKKSRQFVDIASKKKCTSIFFHKYQQEIIMQEDSNEPHPPKTDYGQYNPDWLHLIATMKSGKAYQERVLRGQ
jgi:hypothetical protein